MSRFAILLTVALLSVPGSGLCQSQSHTQLADSQASEAVQSLVNKILNRALTAEKQASLATSDPEAIQKHSVDEISDLLVKAIDDSGVAPDDAKTALGFAALSEGNTPNSQAALNSVYTHFKKLVLSRTSQYEVNSCPSCKTGG